jgi:hypothetical protein
MSLSIRTRTTLIISTIIAGMIAVSFITHPLKKMRGAALAAALAALLAACALPIGEDYIIDIPPTDGIAIPTPINLTSLIPAPATGATPVTSFFAGTYGGTVAWATGKAIDGVFQPSTEYEAVVTLHPATGYAFPDSVQVTHSGAETVPAAFMRSAGGTVPVTIVFPATGGGGGGADTVEVASVVKGLWGL